MRTITKLIFTGMIFIFLTSCSSIYYQVYQATAGPNIQKGDAALIYEDQNCRVTYNLWGEGGNIGFKFYNKTDKTLYVNAGKSFFVLNGIAHDYYKNRTFSNSSKSVSSASTTISGLGYFGLLLSGSNSTTSFNTGSVGYKEEETIAIPPKTAKFFSEYYINTALYRDCNLLKYPKKKEVNPEHFSRADSPFVFSNLIAYHLGETGELIRFENRFYVSEITNYPKDAITVRKTDAFCGEKGIMSHTLIKGSAPDKFFVSYDKSKSHDNFKH